MKVYYNKGSNYAEHKETGVKAKLDYDDVGGLRAIQLEPARSARFTESQSSKIQNDIKCHIENVLSRGRLKEMTDEYFPHDLGGALRGIQSIKPKKKITTRTLQAWLIDVKRASSRTCPEWAVVALEQYVEENRESILEWNSRYEKYPIIDRSDWLWQSENRIVLNADNRCEWRSAQKKRIVDVPAGNVIEVIADRLEQLETKSEGTSSRLQVWAATLNQMPEGATLDEFRGALMHNLMKLDCMEMEVEKTVRDLNASSEEFSSKDGVLPNESKE